jgi:hypothetical protein
VVLALRRRRVKVEAELSTRPGRTPRRVEQRPVKDLDVARPAWQRHGPRQRASTRIKHAGFKRLPQGVVILLVVASGSYHQASRILVNGIQVQDDLYVMSPKRIGVRVPRGRLAPEHAVRDTQIEAVFAEQDIGKTGDAVVVQQVDKTRIHDRQRNH